MVSMYREIVCDCFHVVDRAILDERKSGARTWIIIGGGGAKTT